MDITFFEDEWKTLWVEYEFTVRNMSYEPIARQREWDRAMGELRNAGYWEMSQWAGPIRVRGKAEAEHSLPALQVIARYLGFDLGAAMREGGHYGLGPAAPDPEPATIAGPGLPLDIPDGW